MGRFDNTAYHLGRQISLFEILPTNTLLNCKVLRIDWCFRLYFVLPCFIHFVLLQPLIKHKTCVNELSSNCLPHYGFCYVMSGSQCFSFREEDCQNTKDVNKSQGKLIANLASLICLYFYYTALSRSFSEMFKKKIPFLVLNLTPLTVEVLFLIFCAREAISGFLLSSWNIFAQHCTT